MFLYFSHFCRHSILYQAGHTNFRDENLATLDLQGFDLTAAKLPENLVGTNFTAAQLPKNLGGANLVNANLSNTNLTDVLLPRNLSGVNFTGAQLPQVLMGMNFTRAQLPQDLANINLNSANLSNTDLTQVKLPPILLDVNLTQANLPPDLSQHHLHYANLSHTDFSNVKLPKDLSYTTLIGANLSHMDLSGVKLPKDLLEANLSHANLTRQNFTATNFDWAQLEGVILKKTTCDYQQCFQDNVKTNKLSRGRWYLQNLPKDLKSISLVYPRLSQDTQKAELLQIACGLAYLPYYEGIELYIKVEYWSCKLLFLKKELGTLGNELICSLGEDLEYDAENYSWQTDFPQDQIEEKKEEAPHDDFNRYLKTFQEGLVKYNCESKDKLGYKWYKDNIEKNIKGLQKAYPKMAFEKLRKEAVDIAFQLSKIYQNQHLLFEFRYLFLQNRLIRLKSSTEGARAERSEVSVGVGVENEIYYNGDGGRNGLSSWIRG